MDEKTFRMIIWYPIKLVFILLSLPTLPLAWLLGVNVTDIKQLCKDFIQILLLKKTFWEVYLR